MTSQGGNERETQSERESSRERERERKREKEREIERERERGREREREICGGDEVRNSVSVSERKRAESRLWHHK